MSGAVAALTRHPVKGFTPEHMEAVTLRAGAGFPWDRAFAVEDGPSGFDAAAPGHISKMRFTVLARLPEVALVRTRFEDETGVLHAEAPDTAPIAAKLTEENGREAFATWLAGVLGDQVRGPLRVLPAPGAHRFYDHPRGLISIINIESVRDIERRIGRPIDPLRFRANIYVSGWPAWSELEAINRSLAIGGARMRITQPIKRCAATHVDPDRGVRDIDMLEVLHREFGHLWCGAYAEVEAGGLVRVGDSAERPA